MFSEGAACTMFYVVLQGTLVLTKEGEAPRKVTIGQSIGGEWSAVAISAVLNTGAVLTRSNYCVC